METKGLKKLNKELSWSTRIYTLMTLVVAIGSFVFNAWNTDFALTIIMTIAVVLFIESFAIYFQHHPKYWRAFQILLFLLILAFILIGFRWGNQSDFLS